MAEPAAPAVLLVPGIMGTQLYNDSGLTQLVAWNYLALAQGYWLRLRLSPNVYGSQGTPGFPPASPAYPGSPSPTPWGAAQQALQQQLGASSQVQLYGWDWRQSILTAAQLLATYITTLPANLQPVDLFGHSAGGLVVLMAYRQLTGAGKGNLVRRIVTCGSPLFGSYYVPYACGGNDPTIQTLANRIAGIISAINLYGLLPSTGEGIWPAIGAYISPVILSWPCWNELFPNQATPDAAADPARSAVYAPSNYPPWMGVVPSTLSAAENGIVQTFMANPAAMPVLAPWTAIVCSDFPTPVAFVAGRAVNFASAYSDGPGDGIVPAVSQAGFSATQVSCGYAHASQPAGVTADGTLAAILTAPDTPAAVAVAAPIRPGQQPANVTPAPDGQWQNGMPPVVDGRFVNPQVGVEVMGSYVLLPNTTSLYAIFNRQDTSSRLYYLYVANTPGAGQYQLFGAYKSQREANKALARATAQYVQSCYIVFRTGAANAPLYVSLPPTPPPT
jgi:hypothetical protein